MLPRQNKINEINLLHLIVVPQLCGRWQHNYKTKTKQAGHANDQSTYYLTVCGLTTVAIACVLATSLRQCKWTLRLCRYVLPVETSKTMGYYLDLSKGWSAKPRLEPVNAIGTNRALPRTHLFHSFLSQVVSSLNRRRDKAGCHQM